MSDKLRKQIAVEREQLKRLLEVHRPLLTKCASHVPDDIELSALAAMLHSFYTGIENIFKRIAIELDATPPTGEAWHRKLLEAMTLATATRKAVISMPARERLVDYLQFRHVFRQAYSFQLRWEKMSRLVLDCDETLRLLEAELDDFIASITQDG